MIVNAIDPEAPKMAPKGTCTMIFGLNSITSHWFDIVRWPHGDSLAPPQALGVTLWVIPTAPGP